MPRILAVGRKRDAIKEGGGGEGRAKMEEGGVADSRRWGGKRFGGHRVPR